MQQHFLTLVFLFDFFDLIVVVFFLCFVANFFFADFGLNFCTPFLGFEGFLRGCLALVVNALGVKV